MLDAANVEWRYFARDEFHPGSYPLASTTCQHCEGMLAGIWEWHGYTTTNPLGESFKHDITKYMGDACTYCQYVMPADHVWQQIPLKDFVAKYPKEIT